MSTESMILKHGIIVAEEAFYDDDKKLYGTYVGLNNKEKTLLFTAWDTWHIGSKEKAEWLVSKLHAPESVCINLTTNIVFKDREHVIAVYKIQFDNGYYYIGSTKNLKARFQCHRSNFQILLKKVPLVQRCIDLEVKSGEFIMLQSFTTTKDSYNYEKDLINLNKNDKFLINLKDYLIER